MAVVGRTYRSGNAAGADMGLLRRRIWTPPPAPSRTAVPQIVGTRTAEPERSSHQRPSPERMKHPDARSSATGWAPIHPPRGEAPPPPGPTREHGEGGMRISRHTAASKGTRIAVLAGLLASFVLTSSGPSQAASSGLVPATGGALTAQ